MAQTGGNPFHPTDISSDPRAVPAHLRTMSLHWTAVSDGRQRSDRPLHRTLRCFGRRQKVEAFLFYAPLTCCFWRTCLCPVTPAAKGLYMGSYGRSDKRLARCFLRGLAPRAWSSLQQRRHARPRASSGPTSSLQRLRREQQAEPVALGGGRDQAGSSVLAHSFGRARATGAHQTCCQKRFHHPDCRCGRRS